MFFGLFKTQKERELEQKLSKIDDYMRDTAQLTREVYLLQQQMEFIYKNYIRDIPPEDVPFFMESRLSEDPMVDYPLGDVINGEEDDVI